jgi:hypothetical protein
MNSIAARRRFRALFNDDWQDPVGYDLVLNSGRVSAETAASIIVALSRSSEFQLTPGSRAAFDDLTTTARVQAALITSQKTRNVVLNIRSEGGRVSVWYSADPNWERGEDYQNGAGRYSGCYRHRAASHGVYAPMTSGSVSAVSCG